jgi:D-glycero-D-manno-heptose 1,7-bisphosphate phosphatase
MPSAKRRPAVFLDRDGTLNADTGYLHRIEDFRWMPEAREAVRYLNDRDYLVFVVTNQSGVGRGYYNEADVDRLHAWMQGELARIGAHIDDFRYCPHHPQATLPAYRQVCACRKPGAGMLRELIKDWSLDPAGSLMIGDRPSDLAAAAAAGVRGVLYQGGSLLALCRQALEPG